MADNRTKNQIILDCRKQEVKDAAIIAVLEAKDKDSSNTIRVQAKTLASLKTQYGDLRKNLVTANEDAEVAQADLFAEKQDTANLVATVGEYKQMLDQRDAEIKNLSTKLVITTEVVKHLSKLI